MRKTRINTSNLNRTHFEILEILLLRKLLEILNERFGDKSIFNFLLFKTTSYSSFYKGRSHSSLSSNAYVRIHVQKRHGVHLWSVFPILEYKIERESFQSTARHHLGCTKQYTEFLKNNPSLKSVFPSRKDLDLVFIGLLDKVEDWINKVDSSDQDLGLLLKNTSAFEMKLVDMDISVRTLNCLKSADIETLPVLARRSTKELLSIPNFGKESLREVEDLLGSKGFSLGDDLSLCVL